MASRAYVLIEATVGRAREITRALKEVRGVTEAYLITGPYDIIAIVEGGDTNAVSHVVTGSIHGIPGVARTITCLTIDIP